VRVVEMGGRKRLVYRDRTVSANGEKRDLETPIVDKHYVDTEIAKLKREIELLKKILPK